MKFINKFGIVISAIFVAMFLVLAAAYPAAASANNGRNNGQNGNGEGHTPVTVCHKPGTPAQDTLTFDDDGLQAHLDHGDTLGACEELGEPPVVTEPTTTTTEVEEPTTTTEAEQPTTTVEQPTTTVVEEPTTTTVQESTTTTAPVVVECEIQTRAQWRTYLRSVDSINRTSVSFSVPENCTTPPLAFSLYAPLDELPQRNGGNSYPLNQPLSAHAAQSGTEFGPGQHTMSVPFGEGCRYQSDFYFVGVEDRAGIYPNNGVLANGHGPSYISSSHDFTTVCEVVIPDPTISFECSDADSVSYSTDATRIKFFDAEGNVVLNTTEQNDEVPEFATNYKLVLQTDDGVSQVRGDIPELDCSDNVAPTPFIETECVADGVVGYNVSINEEGSFSVTVNGIEAPASGEVAAGDVIEAVGFIESKYEGNVVSETVSVTADDCAEIETPAPFIVQECLTDGRVLVTVVFPGNPTFTDVVTSNNGRPTLTNNGLGGFAFTINGGDTVLATSTFDTNYDGRIDVSTTAIIEDCTLPTEGTLLFECNTIDGLVILTVTVDFDNDFNSLYVNGVPQELNTATGASYTVQPGDEVLLTSVRNGEEVSVVGTAPPGCVEVLPNPVPGDPSDTLPVTGSSTATFAAIAAFLMLLGGSMVFGSRRRLA